MWPVLIQCRLVGKATRVYNALEEGIARDYQKVKALVLKAYDLVPKAYRLKFRNDNKHPSRSFVEFARVKENQFDDWITSRQVVSFASLREMLLLEEFKKACSKELRVHPEEVKVVKVSNAAQLADEYVLTHRSGASSFSFPSRTDPSSQISNNVNRVEPSSPMSKNNANSFSGGNKGAYLEGLLLKVVLVIEVCPCPMPLIGTITRVLDIKELASGVTNQDTSTTSAMPVGGHINVKFLRDTGSARSLVLGTSLPGLTAYSGNYVVLGGFPNTVVSAPLVEVRLSFPGYDGITELAVGDNLPIRGIDGILGNDMLNREGRELFPILSVEAYPVSVTTRASARAAELDKDDDLLLSSLEVDVERPGSVDEMNNPIVINDLKPDWDRSVFIKAQKAEFNF
ncbi:uncharacterized protein [Palaemon carinicauda]|uniref:uncharacterized protein n=1 Tax=Palaemon carinicauda TaxID=392227 RepID=UPI0035B616CE